MQIIAKSKNSVPVYFDPLHSHAATHLDDTPGLEALVKEIVGQLELSGQEVGGHYDMGRTVGTCDVVRVDKSDHLVYGVRKNREDDGLVPFVKNRKGDPCSSVTVHLLPRADKAYTLSSTWIGTFDDDEPFPLSKKANERSIEYWNKRAFVYGSQEIIAGTETNICPW